MIFPADKLCWLPNIMKRSPFPFTRSGNLTAGLPAALLLAMTLAAADADLPAAKDVLASHIKAVGGRDAVMQLSGLRIKGEFKMAAVGLTAPLEIVRARPNKQATKLTAAGFGEVTSGFDGKVAWSIDPMGGAKLLQGKMLEQSRDDADFYSQFMIQDEKLVASLKTVGRAQFDGRECLEVKLDWKSGRTETLFFDAKTGLLAGLKKPQETDGGTVEATVTLRDYKKFGDLSYATKISLKLGDNELAMNFTDYTPGAVPDQEFEPPAAIKELMSAPPAAK